jgi:hypothetical protein
MIARRRAVNAEQTDSNHYESRVSLRDRRILVFILVLLLALLGAGIGSFAFDDEPDRPGTQTPTPDGNESLDVSLVADSNTQLLNASDVVPGTSGTRAVVLRNEGADRGTLTIVETSLTQQENGLVGPEASVDSSAGEGELAEYLLVTVQYRAENGSTVPLYATGDQPRPLSAIATEDRSASIALDPGEQTTIVVDWALPADTGNVVQSDSLRLTAAFRLQAVEE